MKVFFFSFFPPQYIQIFEGRHMSMGAFLTVKSRATISSLANESHSRASPAFSPPFESNTVRVQSVLQNIKC